MPNIFVILKSIRKHLGAGHQPSGDIMHGTAGMINHLAHTTQSIEAKQFCITPKCFCKIKSYLTGNRKTTLNPLVIRPAYLLEKNVERRCKTVLQFFHHIGLPDIHNCRSTLF